MKIKGEFILREIAGDTILIPVGESALKINGMITLDPVAALIWQSLEAGMDDDAIVARILENFDVAEDVARADFGDFITQLRNADMVE